jgi:antitoxin MazE
MNGISWESAMQVSRWGNSLAVRLPKALVEQLGLKEGDQLNVVAAKDGAIEVETNEDQRRRALERMAARNWTLPEGYRFDRDEANERLARSSTPTFLSMPSRLAERLIGPARCSQAVASSACRYSTNSLRSRGASRRKNGAKSARQSPIC